MLELLQLLCVKTAVRFWKIVEEFSPEQRSQLLHYVTSCSRPPLLGFSALHPGYRPEYTFSHSRIAVLLHSFVVPSAACHPPAGFQIQRMHFRGDAAGADSFLPMAATCMNILKLPAYSDIGAW
jgi:hypothetical protein